MEFNNRELAMLAWSGIILVWVLREEAVRRSVRQLLMSVVQPGVLLPVLAFAGYVAGWCWLGAQVEAWSWSLINETVW